jgi:DNA-binding NarL/FixJ family response regulator
LSAGKAWSSIVHVLFIDNDPLVQLGAKTLLNQQAGWVVRSASDCSSALDLCATFKPHVILLGVNGGTDADIEKINILKRRRIPIIAYGSTTNISDLHKLLAAGVDGFIHRSVSRESLVAAIDDCIQGRRTILTGNENNLLYDVLHATHKSTNAPSLLTGREKDVLDCVLQGMSNSEIASELHIAAGTVKAHIGHLLRKHGASSRTKLAIQAAYHTQEN